MSTDFSNPRPEAAPPPRHPSHRFGSPSPLPTLRPDDRGFASLRRRVKAESLSVETDMTLVKLGDRNVFLKREDQNPSGSHKAYAARNYVEHLRDTRWFESGRGTLVLCSSGRHAQAFAKQTEGENVDIIVVSDVLSSPILLDELTACEHVAIDRPLINDPDSTGSHIRARLKRSHILEQTQLRAIFVDQYSDPILAQGYEKYLVPQMIEQAGGEIGGIFAPAGTGGLVNGIVRYREKVGGRWPIFAADAEGSALFRTPPAGSKRRLPGFGNGIKTQLIAEVSSKVVPVWVTDVEAVAGCYHLLERGVYVGPSSGATAAAYLQVIQNAPKFVATDKPIVLVMPDAGDAYRSTVYDAIWLRKNGFVPTVLPALTA